MSLIYQPSQFQRHLWNDYTMADQDAARAESDGRARYEAFPDWAAEMFHYFHADTPDRMETPAPGSDVFQRFDAAMQDVPEVTDLRAQTVGNDTWAGVVTTSMIDDLLKNVAAPDAQVEDVREDAATADYLERLLADADHRGDEEECEAIEDALDEMYGEMEKKGAAASEEADLLDMTNVRQALRNAAANASEQIAQMQAMIDSYGVGLDKHSGRKAQMEAGRKLSKLVGDNERLRKIAELAGRLRRIASEQQRRKPRFGAGERVGRKFSNDLGNLCFRELVYGAPGMRHVFAAKYAESNLACNEKADKQKDHKGPIVMCLDSSGSMMAGDADVWAAAVCLAFMQVAKEQDRGFAIVHFGSSVLRVDKFPGKDAMTPEAITDAVNFFAADGGTNFMRSLDCAVDVIREQGEFKQADIVMVTDGRCSISPQWKIKWNRNRDELDFRCHSILVGTATRKEINESFSDETVVLQDAMRDEHDMHHIFGKV